jgi:nucleotide-binding universal stress UspA family protein
MVDEKRILIAIDGSPAADAAVDAGLELASALQADAVFVHAAPSLAIELFDKYPTQGPPRAEILARDEVLARAVDAANDMGVAADIELIGDKGTSADLAATIAGIAGGARASMIVTGSRGRGSVAGAVLGSVSHNLIKYATVPVLVVHDPNRDQEL